MSGSISAGLLQNHHNGSMTKLDVDLSAVMIVLDEDT